MDDAETVDFGKGVLIATYHRLNLWFSQGQPVSDVTADRNVRAPKLQA